MTWQEHAACVGADPDLFFEGTDRLPRDARRRYYDAALAICAGCPVQAECLRFAVAEGLHYGVWGGRTAEERRKDRMAARRPRGKGRQPRVDSGKRKVTERDRRRTQLRLAGPPIEEAS